MVVAIIGGTGIYDPKIFRGRAKTLKTPYGSASVVLGRLAGRKAVFIARHGRRHEIPPHKINNLANIFALKKLDTERIISINSVGAINESLKPGDIVVPCDFIDFTKLRKSTFYDSQAVHVDVSQAYCPEIRKALLAAADKIVGSVFDGAVYACTEGPRFETPAEIRMMRIAGCDIVGMTGVPEVVLAREQEICYAVICTVTNYAAGISKTKLTAAEVLETVRKEEELMKKIILGTIEAIPQRRACSCGQALKWAKI